VTRVATVDAIDPAAVEAALVGLRGELAQVPPMHSAIWIDGRRAHELAREGVTMAPPPRAVRVDELRVVAIDGPRVTLAIACSKGTYVRALVRDLGAALGTGAVVTALRRTASGRFTLDDALAYDEVNYRRDRRPRLIPTRVALGLPEVAGGRRRAGRRHQRPRGAAGPVRGGLRRGRALPARRGGRRHAGGVRASGRADLRPPRPGVRTP
jgi:tRNA pseudouridine55 synthase